ncbi:MAG: DUF4446 family protein [Clostridium sp.]|nr:DUF4446 family protein [Clostridium sp.]MCI7443068.1 DUF4446 family protein [Clostridium sp.]
MKYLLNNFNEFVPYILGVLIIVIILLFILVIVLFKSLNRVERKYKKFMRGTNGKNIEELILKELENIEQANKNSQEALEECEKLTTKVKGCAQKIAIIRYKAFENVGSDLSFSIAILDGNDDGVLITGIYGREESVTYAKPIDKGISRYGLSEEEKQVLNEAINNEN